MRMMMWTLAVMTISSPAAAQWNAVEVGAGISRACIGSEGGICGDERGTMWATHALACVAHIVPRSSPQIPPSLPMQARLIPAPTSTAFHCAAAGELIVITASVHIIILMLIHARIA